MNAGTIIAGMVGIGALFGDSIVTNTGTVISDDIGILVSSFEDDAAPTGLVVPTTGATVTNDGLIITGGNGVEIDFEATNTVVNNTGEIAAGGTGISTNGFNTTINNSGVITGNVAIDIGGMTTVVNSEDGYIGQGEFFLSGPGVPKAPFPGGDLGDAIYADGFGSLNLTNDGEIFGNINLAAGMGNDVIVNNGVITGDVLLGNGDDMFTAGAGSKVMSNPFDEETLAFEEYGQGGEILGGAGNDTIYGHSQNEIIYGNADEDYLKGRGGNDYLSGGTENDTLIAGGGNDTLLGGSGDDRLIGNQGNNTMIGGEGADRMRAGSGIDTFVWESAADSGTTPETYDVVLSFEAGVDVMDFTSVAAGGPLHYVGTDAFAVTGQTQIQVMEFEGDTFVNVDVDGDGVGDMTIKVQDTFGLTVGDFAGATDELLLG